MLEPRVVAIASDHAGFNLKATLIADLAAMGHAVLDLGPANTDSVDYADFAHTLAGTLTGGKADCGVLVCGSGIGISMAANRHPGIRAAVCHDAFTAEMARRHNDANVLCFGARVLGHGVAEQIVEVFLATVFEGGRHKRRVAKIEPTTGRAQ